MQIGSKKEFSLSDGTKVVAFRINEPEYLFTLTFPDGHRETCNLLRQESMGRPAAGRPLPENGSRLQTEVRQMMQGLNYW